MSAEIKSLYCERCDGTAFHRMSQKQHDGTVIESYRCADCNAMGEIVERSDGDRHVEGAIAKRGDGR